MAHSKGKAHGSVAVAREIQKAAQQAFHFEPSEALQCNKAVSSSKKPLGAKFALQKQLREATKQITAC